MGTFNVDVIASVIVAALVNWNDTVEVTGPLDAQDSIASADWGASFHRFRGCVGGRPSDATRGAVASGPPTWAPTMAFIVAVIAATITATITSTGARPRT